jgi:hypothetical protein
VLPGRWILDGTQVLAAHWECMLARQLWCLNEKVQETTIEVGNGMLRCVKNLYTALSLQRDRGQGGEGEGLNT